MGKIFCVEFQRYPLKFHTKYLTHTLKDMIFIQHWHFFTSKTLPIYKPNHRSIQCNAAKLISGCCSKSVFAHCFGYSLFVIQSPWFRHQLSSNYGTYLCTWQSFLQARMRCKWRHPRLPERRVKTQSTQNIEVFLYATIITPRIRFSLPIHDKKNLKIQNHFVLRLWCSSINLRYFGAPVQLLHGHNRVNKHWSCNTNTNTNSSQF